MRTNYHKILQGKHAQQHKTSSSGQILSVIIWMDQFQVWKDQLIYFHSSLQTKKNKSLQWFKKFCSRKLLVGQRIHAQESKHEEQCFYAWLTVKQIISYYNVQYERNIEMRSIK